MTKSDESTWQRINAVFEEAEILEELTRLRMERQGETRQSALNWAIDQMKRYGVKQKEASG